MKRKAESEFFFAEDVIKNILYRLSMKDLTQNTRLISKAWKACSMDVIKDLMSQFSIPMDLVNTLKSPDLVYKRLTRIFLADDELYTLYCAGDSVDSDFIHLLDNNINWFRKYFANRDQFFIRFNLKLACTIGNFDLVKFLFKTYGYPPDLDDLPQAILSGELDFINFFHKLFKDLTLIKPKICIAAINSGNVDNLQSILKKFDWELTVEELMFCFESDSSVYFTCDSIKMITFLAENYLFNAKKIDSLSLTDLEITKYFFEKLMWEPPESANRWGNDCIISMWHFAYSKGFMDVADYLALKFPDRIKNYLTLENLLKYGDLDELKRRISIEDLKTACAEGRFDGQVLLQRAFESGKLATVQFLVESCQIIPVAPFLLTLAIQSNKVEMVRYLVEEHGYCIDINEPAFSLINLEVASFLYKHMKIDFIMCLESSSNNVLILYHLIQTEDVKPCFEMFDLAFQCRFEDGQDLYELAKYFMQYLIEVHDIYPSIDMIAIAEDEEDEEMLAIFNQPKNLSLSL